MTILEHPDHPQATEMALPVARLGSRPFRGGKQAELDVVADRSLADSRLIRQPREREVVLRERHGRHYTVASVTVKYRRQWAALMTCRFLSRPRRGEDLADALLGEELRRRRHARDHAGEAVHRLLVAVDRAEELQRLR